MENIKEVPKHQEIVYQSLYGRIIVMDSITFSDERNNTHDVLVGASFCGLLAIRFPLRVNPKGVIAHDAGVGKDFAGINGLWALEGMGIPGAAVETMSARLGNGMSMYEGGIISYVNESAEKLGINAGMPVKEAAMKMLQRVPPVEAVEKIKKAVYEGQEGRIMAMGSVTFITLENSSDVICAGSHFGVTSAAYSSRFPDLKGVICNDGGKAKEDSGIVGLNILQEKRIPGAAVASSSARIGDGLSTYEDGVVSAVNQSAMELGIDIGMKTKEAAMRMLKAKQNEG